MGGQVNVSYDDATLAAIDRAAARRGMPRLEFARLVMKTALANDAEGRELFALATTVRPEQVDVLVTNMGKQTTELDRVLAHHAKREAALYKKTEAENADHRARLTAVEAEVSARLKAATVPFKAGLDELRHAIDTHPGLARIDASIRQLDADLEAARPIKNTYIDGGLFPAHWMLITGAIMFMVMGIVGQGLVSQASSFVAVRAANKLLNGDDAFHKLATYRYGHDICAIPAAPPAAATGAAPAKPGHGAAAHRSTR